MILGHATPEGTRRFTARHNRIDSRNYRPCNGLLVSAIGFGTYLGAQNESDDRYYEAAIQGAVRLGCNLIDTAVNYRCMRSERNIGVALGQLIKEGVVARDEVVICTKGGFIPFDGSPPADVNGYFRTRFLDRGLCRPEDIVAGCHCMEPAYLQDQIRQSRENLGLGTIDLYYLHNPETQLEKISPEQFYQKLGRAFAALEEAVIRGEIRAYGVASWTAFRDAGLLSLEKCVATARQAGGDRHHFRAIQLPFNLGMPEAVVAQTQQIAGQAASSLAAATHLELPVFCSASILQGGIVGKIPKDLAAKFPGLESDAQRGLQFVLSTPGVTAALVGMRQLAHVRANLRVLELPPLTSQTFMEFFKKA